MFTAELSVVQAALLIVGEDPAESQEYIARWQPEDRPKGYDAVKTALINAIKRKQLRADIPEGEDDFGKHYGPYWEGSTILVDDLRMWLKSRGVKTGFFFPLAEGPDYLSEFHPNYSQKLAAAIRCAGKFHEHEFLDRPLLYKPSCWSPQIACARRSTAAAGAC